MVDVQDVGVHESCFRGEIAATRWLGGLGWDCARITCQGLAGTGPVLGAL